MADKSKRLNACDSQVLYGAYDQGHRPDIAIFSFEFIGNGGGREARPVGSMPQAWGSTSIINATLPWGLALVHEGASLATDVGMCGLPSRRAQGSIVVDGFLGGYLGEY